MRFLNDDNFESFQPKSAVWIPAAGFAERMRPYSYLRAKACLPIARWFENGIKKHCTIWQNIVNSCRCYINTDLFILTAYYRPYDFQDVLEWNKKLKVAVLNFTTEVCHGTACDFDLLRIYFPSVSIWYIILGDLIFHSDCLSLLNHYDNCALVGQPTNHVEGTFHFRGGCQWFREKSTQNFGETERFRWRGVLKMDFNKFKKSLPEPFLCTKSERHCLHGKSFQETFMEAIVGNYALFEPISITENEIESIGDKESYEKHIGKPESEIMELLRQDGGSGSRSRRNIKNRKFA